MDKEEEAEGIMVDLGTVTVVMGMSSSEGLIFLAALPSASVDALLLEPPSMLGFFIIKDFLFFKMLISCLIHSSASEALFCKEASRFSIILFKLLILR